MQSEKLTYTITEAAGAIGVGRGSAYQLIRQGKLRHVQIGRRVVVPKHSVREFLGLPAEEDQAPDAPSSSPLNILSSSEANAVSYVVTIRRVRGQANEDATRRA